MSKFIAIALLALASLITEALAAAELASPAIEPIRLKQLLSSLHEFREASELVLYCNDSCFTRMAERILLNHKVQDFVHLDGGCIAWQDARLPIENSLE